MLALETNYYTFSYMATCFGGCLNYLMMNYAICCWPCPVFRHFGLKLAHWPILNMDDEQE